MGGKCSKEMKVLNAELLTNKEQSNTTSRSEKIAQVKSSSTHQSTKSKEMNSLENKITLHSEKPEKGDNLRKNSKKHKIVIENLKSNESQVLTIVKKNNRECADAKLIENCLSKHFFMRVLDKMSRYFL
jgi:hypothetical protein